MSAASAHACTCPQQIRIENHQAVTGQYWKDPRWRPLSDAFLKENKTCAFCGGKATLVHHDNVKSYSSQEEYYNPANFTAACATCHHNYRTGFIICPVCRQHYMKPGNEMCQRCRGLKSTGGQFRATYKKAPRHPCGHRIAMQRCQRDGGCFVCARSSKDALGCDHFIQREPVRA